MVDWPPVGQVLVLRHGQSEWNAAGRWQGWADIELTELGEAQARHAGIRLASLGLSFGSVVASDLLRAQRTAALVADELGFDPAAIETEPELKEFNVGEWSGLTRAEIEQQWPGQLEAWWRGALTHTPGGELRTHFVERVAAAVRGLTRRPGDVLVISHGGVVGALQEALGVDGDRPRITNLSGRWFSAASDGAAPHGLVAGALLFLLDADETTVSPTA